MVSMAAWKISLAAIFALTTGQCWGQNFTFTDDACHTKMGECVPEQDCEHPGLAHLPCAAEGTVCCHPSHQARTSDFELSLSDAEYRKRECSLRKCRWYNGFWVTDPLDCTPKQRLVMFCPDTKQYCCAPPCYTRNMCSDQGGFCGPKQNPCFGEFLSSCCRGKMCFCCLPNGEHPPCSCPDTSAIPLPNMEVDVCSSPTMVLKPNDCLKVLSPNYPFTYQNNLECILKVEVPPGYTLDIKFVDVALDLCPFDTLTIDGTNQTEPACGYNSYPNVMSDGNSITINFTTDGNQTYRGFSISMAPIGDPTTTTSTTTTTTTSTSTTTTTTTTTPDSTTTTHAPPCQMGETYNVCGQRTITAPSGTVRSPNYPANYNVETLCYLTIQAPPDCYLVLTFNFFIMQPAMPECLYDYLKIFDVRYCGTTTPGPYNLTTNVFTFEYKTDDAINFPGWEFCFQAIPIP